MSAVSLLPRLSPIGVFQVLERLGKEERPTPSESIPAELEPFVSFGPSGGTRHTAAAAALAGELREIAAKCGFPETKSLVGQAKFDRDAAILLGQHTLLDSGEALRDDVWAHLTSVSAPDIADWRFPDRSPERFQGGVRNAFQRLWVRGTTLDRGTEHPERWALVGALTEDAMVAIFERPVIGARRRLAIAVAEAWVEAAKQHGRSAMQSIMRNAIKILRLKNLILDLSVLPDDELNEAIGSCFKEGAQATNLAERGQTARTSL